MGSELQRVLSTAGIRSDMFRLGKAWFGRSISVFCYKFDMCTIHICAFIHTYIYIQYNTPSKPHWCSGWRLAISFQCKFWRVLGYKLQRITQLASIAESGGHQELLCLNSLPQKGIAGTPLTDGVWDDRRLDKIRPDEKTSPRLALSQSMPLCWDPYSETLVGFCANRINGGVENGDRATGPGWLWKVDVLALNRQ